MQNSCKVLCPHPSSTPPRCPRAFRRATPFLVSGRPFFAQNLIFAILGRLFSAQKTHQKSTSSKDLPNHQRRPKSAQGELWAPFLVPFPNIFLNMYFSHRTHAMHTRTLISRSQALKMHPFWGPFSAPFSTPFRDPLRDLLLEPFMSPWCSKGRFWDPLWAPLGSQMAPKRAPKAPKCFKNKSQAPFKNGVLFLLSFLTSLWDPLG